jgi:signal transduction histidine kinase
MARRIVLTVLALITVLLAVLAVPLGLLTAAQDRRGFRQETSASAAALASVAEERIGDGEQGPSLQRSVRKLASSGDEVTVYDAVGRDIAGTSGAAVAAGQVRAGRPGSSPRAYWQGHRLLVLAPVVPDSDGGAIGTVALSRSTGPVEHRITMLWTLIAAVSAAGLLAAAIAAIALARWVSRPLTALAAATRRLGDGALDTRAPAGSGPAEVRRLSATFNTMAGRLQSLVYDHRSMMADVSHQVRTPLAALRLRLDLLAQDADEATAAELAGAQDEIARLTRMVSGLLAVARAENVTAAPVRVSVDAVIDDRAAAWRPAAQERGVTLDTAAGEPVSADLRDGHLEQILDNLIANALDVLPAGGTIQVAVTAAGGQARVTVADNGPGMSGQQQRAAFRRFAVGSPGGTGLGLAIVDRLAVTNGGAAALSDTAGGGLTVTIEFPLAASPHGSRWPGVSPSGNPGNVYGF